MHLDLKPENILIGDGGRAELCDFGQARMLENRRSGFTTRRPLVGTIQYAAPELETNKSPAADIYAFASVILYVLSGKVPFPPRPGLDTYQSILLKKKLGEIPTPDEYPIQASEEFVDQAWTLMRDCWKTQPEERLLLVQVGLDLRHLLELAT